MTPRERIIFKMMILSVFILLGMDASLLATAFAGDAEMAARIARHQRDRLLRSPDLITHEVGPDLATAIRAHSRPQTLVVVDCLTLWLTQCLSPLTGAPLSAAAWQATQADLLAAVQAAPGPLVLVSNEITLGLMPVSPEARHCVDVLGVLHQAVAAVCQRLILMVAGQPLVIKGAR